MKFTYVHYEEFINVGETLVVSHANRQTHSREKLQEYLASHGIATTIYYPLSLHLQEVYKSLGYKLGDFPNSEQAQIVGARPNFIVIS